VIFFTLLSPSPLEAKKRTETIDELRQEIILIFKNKNLDFLEKKIESVSVEFLINARNEIVIIDAFGDSELACEYVKKMMNYKHVKYTQARQLTRYLISIRLKQKF
jgi:hypothetical protein